MAIKSIDCYLNGDKSISIVLEISANKSEQKLFIILVELE